MKYRVVMSNGDWAEAETLAAALLAGATMVDDAHGASFAKLVYVDGVAEEWAQRAAFEHTLEIAAGRRSS